MKNINLNISTESIAAETKLNSIINKTIVYQNTVEGLQTKYTDLNSIMKTMDLGSSQFGVLQGQINKVKAEMQQAEQVMTSMALKGVGAQRMQYGSLNSTLMGLRYTLQDLPFGFIGIQNNLPMLFEGFKRLQVESGSTWVALKTLGSGLVGPLGIGIAFSAVTSLITYLTMHTGKAKEKILELGNEFLSLREKIAKVTGENEQIIKSFQDATNLMVYYAETLAKGNAVTEKYLRDTGRLTRNQDDYNESLRKYLILKEKILELQNKDAETSIAGYEYKKGISSVGDLYGLNKPVLEDIKKLAEKELSTMGVGAKGIVEHTQRYKELEKTIKLVEKALDSYSVKLDKEIKKKFVPNYKESADEEQTFLMQRYTWRKLLADKERKEELEKQKKFQDELAKLVDKKGALHGFGFWKSGNDKLKDGKSKEDYAKEDMDLLKKDYDALWQATSESMRNLFSGAWESIFGEANSLLEKFLSRFAEGLLNATAEKAATSVFTTLLGLAGLAKQAPQLSTQSYVSTNYLVVDGEVLGKFVDNRMPYSYNKALALRKI